MAEVVEKLPAGTAAKVRKLIEVAREREAELAAVLREIETLINGGEGIGALLKQAEAAFGLAWSTRYPGAYVWQYQKDRPHMKRLIGSLVTPSNAPTMTKKKCLDRAYWNSSTSSNERFSCAPSARIRNGQRRSSR